MTLNGRWLETSCFFHVVTALGRHFSGGLKSSNIFTIDFFKIDADKTTKLKDLHQSLRLVIDLPKSHSAISSFAAVLAGAAASVDQ